MNCPNCGHPIQRDDAFCTYCGNKVESETPELSTCPNCGNEVQANDTFCTNCGTNLETASSPLKADETTITQTEQIPQATQDPVELKSNRDNAQPSVDRSIEHKESSFSAPLEAKEIAKEQEVKSKGTTETSGETPLHTSSGKMDTRTNKSHSSIPIYLWPLVLTCLEAAGIIGTCVFLTDPMGVIGSIQFWTLLSVIGLASVVIAILDINYLTSIGIRGGWKWSILILPLYLFIRAAKTNRKYLIPIVYTGLMVIGIVLQIVGPGIAVSNMFAEDTLTGDEDFISMEAQQDGIPVTYEQLLAEADKDALDISWTTDIAISGVVEEVSTQNILDEPVPLYIVAADGDRNQLLEVLCTEMDPDPVPQVGDTVICDGMYLGKVESLPRIIGTVFLQSESSNEETTIVSMSPTSTPIATATQNLNFTLSLEQAKELAEEVAGPLLLAEWYGTIESSANYNDSIWGPADWSGRVVDLTGRMVPGDVDHGASLWFEYMMRVRDIIGSNKYSGTTRPNDSSIFGSGSSENEGGYLLNAAAIQSYFQDAFGNSNLAEVVRSEAASAIQTDPNGDWLIYGGDGAYWLEMNLPTTSVNVVNGNVTFTGYIYCDAPWVAPLAITLEVEQAPNSRYGCHVLRYKVGPAPESVVPADLRASLQEMVPQSSGTFDENGFVFADSSERYLTPDDLAGLSQEMLGFARNEIFARNGNLFKTDKYIDHFNSYSWYQAMPNKRYDVDLEDLNEIERANVVLIQQQEAQRG